MVMGYVGYGSFYNQIKIYILFIGTKLYALFEISPWGFLTLESNDYFLVMTSTFVVHWFHMLSNFALLYTPEFVLM